MTVSPGVATTRESQHSLGAGGGREPPRPENASETSGILGRIRGGGILPGEEITRSAARDSRCFSPGNFNRAGGPRSFPAERETRSMAGKGSSAPKMRRIACPANPGWVGVDRVPTPGNASGRGGGGSGRRPAGVSNHLAYPGRHVTPGLPGAKSYFLIAWGSQKGKGPHKW